MACCRLSSGKLIRFYQLIPLYDEELQVKMQYESIDALLEKFDDDFSYVVDIHRKHYLK
ncbi:MULTISPECIES: suppressor of fused domain protein [Erysipelotrichaceae]|uniref:Suppressor of fused domain protein n=1 Tax=Amedibacillus hominis TaxID=2897776 RepID=A0ABS9RDS9_9FIRM|nr:MULTISPECIES: suppressor of fused domain protein [unclassified Absiella]MCH4287383.1 suppressor of fused domain protein [Amedibacillus hominis]